MDKIEEIEKKLAQWEAKHEASKGGENDGILKYTDGYCDGLALALGILKQPSNTQMQSDAAKPLKCTHCGYEQLTCLRCGSRGALQR